MFEWRKNNNHNDLKIDAIGFFAIENKYSISVVE